MEGEEREEGEGGGEADGLSSTKNPFFPPPPNPSTHTPKTKKKNRHTLSPTDSERRNSTTKQRQTAKLSLDRCLACPALSSPTVLCSAPVLRRRLSASVPSSSQPPWPCVWGGRGGEERKRGRGRCSTVGVCAEERRERRACRGRGGSAAGVEERGWQLGWFCAARHLHRGMKRRVPSLRCEVEE